MILWTLLFKSCWQNQIKSFQQCLAAPAAARRMSEQCPMLLMPHGQLLGEATLQLWAVALGLALSCTASSTGTWAGAGHWLFGQVILLEKSRSFYIDKVSWKAIIPSGRLPLSIATAFI